MAEAIDLPEATYDSQRRPSLFAEELRALVDFLPFIVHLIRRNVTARYKRSALGVLWTLLDPLATMVIMAVVFSHLFGRDIPAYPIFLLTAILVWNFIAQASTSSILDLLSGSWLIGKAYVPRSVFVMSAVGSHLINFLISLIPLTVIALFFGFESKPALLLLPFSLLLIILFTAGLGLLVSALAVFYNDVQNIYSIGLRLVIYLSGIFYTVEALPEAYRPLILLNPVYNLIQLF
ncbi:MAG: ABC transporter permease, partial [Anaerolineales bacterium]